MFLLAVNKESPAPNTYNLGTTIGKATSVTLSGRRTEPYDGNIFKIIVLRQPFQICS